MKKLIMILFCLSASLCLCACGNTGARFSTDSTTRMVLQITVTAEPEDPAMARAYAEQEQLSPIMRMLREINADQSAEASPYTSGEHIRYDITVTYSNGRTNCYSILDNRYFRMGNAEWYEVDPEKVSELIRFLKDTHTDTP